MQLKLGRVLNKTKDRLYYVVYDSTTKKTIDSFEFPRFNIMPTIEAKIFEYCTSVFNKTFNNCNYDVEIFNGKLLDEYKIFIVINSKDNKYKLLNYLSSDLIRDIYMELRHKDLRRYFTLFEKKISNEGMFNIKNKILNMDIKSFSSETVFYYMKLKETLNFNGDDKVLLDEVLNLVIYDAYKQNLARVEHLDELHQRLGDLLDKKNKTTQEEEEQNKVYNEFINSWSGK